MSHDEFATLVVAFLPAFQRALFLRCSRVQRRKDGLRGVRRGLEIGLLAGVPVDPPFFHVLLGLGLQASQLRHSTRAGSHGPSHHAADRTRHVQVAGSGFLELSFVLGVGLEALGAGFRSSALAGSDCRVQKSFLEAGARSLFSCLGNLFACLGQALHSSQGNSIARMLCSCSQHAHVAHVRELFSRRQLTTVGFLELGDALAIGLGTVAHIARCQDSLASSTTDTAHQKLGSVFH